MDRGRRSALFFGFLLIIVGIILLAIRWVPGLEGWAERIFDWPVIIIGVGAFLLVLGLVTNTPGLAVPACVVGGIGGILYWQNATGNWESWSYIWALIPGFVGVGVILDGLLSGRLRNTLGGGLWLILISLIMLVIFGSFLGGWAWTGDLRRYWPALLILLGLFILGQGILRRRPEE